jgi:2-phospho-L-lactate guanylyltransferase
VTVVVPFRSGGKSRLPAEIRVEVALAMLEDVLEAARSHPGRVRLVTSDAAAALVAQRMGAEIVDDPGGGQGPAVQAGLRGIDGGCLVVNADLPCATPAALGRLAAASPALVAASDGTTNALALPGPEWFASLYGPGSAARFAAAGLRPVPLAELEQDVDTLADLQRLALPAGPRTTLVLDHHNAGRERVS